MYLLAVGRRWISAVLVLGAPAATVAVVAGPRACPGPRPGPTSWSRPAWPLVTVVGFAWSITGGAATLV